MFYTVEQVMWILESAYFDEFWVCASTHHLGWQLEQLEQVDGEDSDVKGVTSPPQDNIQGWLHKPEFWTKNIFLMIPWKNEKIRFFEIFGGL